MPQIRKVHRTREPGDPMQSELTDTKVLQGLMSCMNVPAKRFGQG